MRSQPRSAMWLSLPLCALAACTPQQHAGEEGEGEGDGDVGGEGEGDVGEGEAGEGEGEAFRCHLCTTSECVVDGDCAPGEQCAISHEVQAGVERACGTCLPLLDSGLCLYADDQDCALYTARCAPGFECVFAYDLGVFIARNCRAQAAAGEPCATPDPAQAGASDDGCLDPARCTRVPCVEPDAGGEGEGDTGVCTSAVGAGEVCLHEETVDCALAVYRPCADALQCTSELVSTPDLVERACE